MYLNIYFTIDSYDDVKSTNQPTNLKKITDKKIKKNLYKCVDY